MATASVKGSVTRVFYNGRGAEVTESFTLQGKEFKKRWTAWFEQPHGLSEGTEVEVSGLHGDEIDEWEKDGETRRAVKRSLNKARIVGQQAAAAPSAAEPWASTQPPAQNSFVPTAGTYSDEVPW